MAISGKFLADFEAFYSAVQKAEVELRGMETGAGKVGTSLNRMVDNFSGRKVIQDATLMAEAVERIGGTSKLTEQELERVAATATEAATKMKAMGVDVPPGIAAIATQATKTTDTFGGMKNIALDLAGAFGIAFSIGTVVNFAREMLSAADTLTKLHDRTGLSIEALQRFQAAGDDAGNTVDEIAAAIVQLEDRVAGGDKSAAAAFRKLGINIEEFRNLSPEEKFVAFSDAIRKSSDSGEQLNTTMDAMGRAGATVLPTLKRGFDDLGEGAVGMSASSVAALDRFGDAVAKFARDFKNSIGSQVAADVKLFERTFTSYEAALANAGAAAEANRPKFVAVNEALTPPGLPADLDAIEKELTQNAEALIKAGQAAEKAATQYRAFLNFIGEREIEDHARAIEAMEQREKAWRDYQNMLGERQMQEEAARLKQQAAAHEAARASQAAAEAAWLKSVNDGLLIIDNSTRAQATLGQATTSATSQMVQGYAAVAQQVQLTADAVRALIELEKFSAAARAIEREQPGSASSFFAAPTSASQFRRISQLPSFQEGSGGVRDFGSGTLAMLHGKEAVIPAGDLGSTVQHNTFIINGTAEDVARKVMDEMTRLMKQGRKWPGA